MGKFFYCQSYQIFNIALHYKNVLNEDIHVITADPNIIQACEFFNVSYLKHKKFTSIKKDFTARSRLVKEEINRIVNKIGLFELHYSHTQSSLFCMLLINNLGSNLIFHDFEIVYPRYKLSFSSFKSLIIYYHKYLSIVILKLIYGKIPLVLRKVNISGIMIGIDLDFVLRKSTLVHYLANDYFKTTLDLFKKTEISQKSYKYLFIAQNHDIDKIKQPNEYNRTLFAIYDILEEYGCMMKKHPKFNGPILIPKSRELAEFIPVEFFFNHVEKCIISFHSASLITASFFKNIKAISLLNLIDIGNNEFLRSWKENMTQKSENRIYFPDSIEEFKKLLT